MSDRYVISPPADTDTGQWEVCDTQDCSNGEPYVAAIFSSEYVDAEAWAVEFANLRNAEDQRGRGGFAERKVGADGAPASP